MTNTTSTPYGAKEAKKTITRSVCRVGIGHRDITVEVDESATESEIRDALIDKACDSEFSDNSSEYHLTDEPADEKCQSADYKAVLTKILSVLGGLGFGTEENINGADAVEQLGEAYSDAISKLAHTDLEPRVVYAPSEGSFWSNVNGWDDLCWADHFYGDVNLPLASLGDARLILLSEAKAIEAAATSTGE